MRPDHALVLFSAGQDSATCLAWALERYAHVETIGFDYGQRHAVELSQRPILIASVKAAFPAWEHKLGPDHLIDIKSFGAIGDSALTANRAIAIQVNGLPSTFVPGRNLAFLVYAAAVADRRGLGTLVAGMCETDFSGYPDCRAETLAAQLAALRLGMARDFQLETPLMHLTKAATWRLAHALGGQLLVDLIVEHSHTCYRGNRTTRHDWGYGCAACPACDLRAQGWAEFGA
jgi:7-cyano-7-deazaguanine synthase